jgi:PAS domain-containing protein
MSRVNESYRLLADSFVVLNEHLTPLRDGTLGGFTALRTRLDRLDIPALAADNRGQYVAVNRAAACLAGLMVRELEARSVWDLTPEVEARTGERLWAAFLSTGEQQGTYTLVTAITTVDVVYYSRAHVLPNIHISLLTLV